ncbi:hypothetical protein [Streptomyces pilosus]|uniref:hypothetical protein n=1 Tax=Streptomyces pilosus TaxID=28893 RepID=UPI0036439A6D
MARAGDAADGDLILAGLGVGGADYFDDQCTARPEPYDPACGCGVWLCSRVSVLAHLLWCGHAE